MTDEQIREITAPADSGMVSVMMKAEIDQQITTAKAYPRSIKRFRDECLEMVTLTESIADECIYAIPRDGKTIEGPSARFAEVVASAWGNCRAAARVIGEEGDFIVAQGVFHDMEKNVHIAYEVQRRIVNRDGIRFKPDMIGVTANAACSIALRNAILKGVPKAFWSDMYEAARKVVMGDSKTLSNRRAEALTYLQKFGVTPAMVCATLNVPGVEDIGLEQLLTLRGLATAIKDGDTTVEQAFGAATMAASADPKHHDAPLTDEQAKARMSLVADLGAIAEDGVEALEKTWAALSEESRDLIGPAEFERLKKVAAAKTPTKS
jgi:hypothetical protein